MQKGRITIPTDKDLFETTKYFAEKWGADAILNSTVTQLPENADEIVPKRYKMFFTSHEDDDYAYAHDEYMQNVALITERKVATEETLEIDLMKGISIDQMRVNPENHKKYWQVFDRTTGEEVDSWEYLGNNIVKIFNAKKYHEYTVNFFAKILWNATHISNYFWNNWTCRKARDIDPIFPEAFEEILKQVDKWIENNPKVNVVRFTTFFYHFFILYHKDSQQRNFDMYNYAMSASPAMFERFYQEYGYEIKLEDLVTAGSYANHFLIPSKAVLDYRDLVQRFVSETMGKIIEKFHQAGIETMMFLGDSWIGAEPYGKYFEKMNLDAVVSVGRSGVTFRLLSDIPNVKYREIRLQPYFINATLYDDEVASHTLKRNWITGRRAMMRKPVDRLGFGGFLRIAEKFPKFCDTAEEVFNEFRKLYEIVTLDKPYSVLRLAILNYWGKERSWMTNMVAHDVPLEQTAKVLEFLESLSGLPIDIEFISFEDAKNGRLKEFDVVINAGLAGTAFSGGECWKDEQLLTCVREYVANGGGFIGIGEPTAVNHNGRFFQLADVLGVEKELGFTFCEHHIRTQAESSHFITEDVTTEIDFADGTRDVYALENTQIINVIKGRQDFGRINLSANSYFNGRSVYLSGLAFNAENTRLLYRALLWCANKEDRLYKAFSSNLNVECNYYPNTNQYGLVNNTKDDQTTEFYDIHGNKQTVEVKAYGLLWIDGN